MKKPGISSQPRKSAVEPLESRVLLSASPAIVGYLPDYEFSHFNSIDLSALTEINYFSVIANSSGNLGSTSASGYNFSQLQTVVTAAHSAPSRVSVSITIDPASAFLAIAQSSSATSNFVTNILAFCAKYHLDGIDLDYEPGNGSLTQAQMNSWGGFLATLHAQTSANGLVLSEAVQVSPPYIIPKAYLGDVDRYFVMVYALDYNSSAPYGASISYLNGWVNYGVPKADLYFGMPFYGSSGTSWSNSTAESYSQIVTSYEAANGGVAPAPNLDSVTINGVTWGYNGVDTIEEKTQYAMQNGFGGVMIWELGQDYFTSGGTYAAPSLLPAIKSTVGTAWETWTGAVSSDWNNSGNWNFGEVPTSSTNVIINGGTPTIGSPFSVGSIAINGGKLTLSAVGGTYTTSSLSVSSGATLDLGTNKLFIDYGTNADPIATIAGYISSGYAGGAWTGTGIMSSAAQLNAASYGIGYADSADANNPAGLAAGQIELMYTLLGDANLDGAVNSIDFAILSSNFNQAVSGWDQGDFNYDGSANSIDFALLSSNFNKGVTVAVTALPAAAVPATTPAQSTTNTDLLTSVSATDQNSAPSNAAHHPKAKHKK